MSPLTKEQFMAQLAMQIGENADVLYQQFLASQIDPFPLSNKPLAAPDSEIEKTGDTIAAVEGRVEALEKAVGQEKLALAVGGVLVNIGLAYVGMPKA